MKHFYLLCFICAGLLFITWMIVLWYIPIFPLWLIPIKLMMGFCVGIVCGFTLAASADKQIERDELDRRMKELNEKMGIDFDKLFKE